MNFLKNLFNSRDLTLPELISLNAKDGLYKGEILKELKNVVLFVGFSEQPAGAPSFNDPNLQVLVAPAPDGRGIFLLSFVDHASLLTTKKDCFPYMIDYNSILKIMENPAYLGLIVVSQKEHVGFMKHELPPVTNLKIEK